MIKTVTFFTTLCRLAREEYEAKKFGSPEEARAAADAHYAYKQLCLSADEMIVPGEPRRIS